MLLTALTSFAAVVLKSLVTVSLWVHEFVIRVSDWAPNSEVKFNIRKLQADASFGIERLTWLASLHAGTILGGINVDLFVISCVRCSQISSVVDGIQQILALHEVVDCSKGHNQSRWLNHLQSKPK